MDDKSKKRESLSVPPEVVEFAHQVGNFIEYWGFKNVQGQIWAYLFLSEVPLETGELISRTGISKGLASIYIKEMLEYGVIEEAGKGQRGVVSYRANPDQEQVIFNVLRKRERVIISRIEAAWTQCSNLPSSELKEAGVSKAGLVEAGNLIRQATTLMDLFIRSKSTAKSVLSRLMAAF